MTEQQNKRATRHRMTETLRRRSHVENKLFSFNIYMARSLGKTVIITVYEAHMKRWDLHLLNIIYSRVSRPDKIQTYPDKFSFFHPFSLNNFTFFMRLSENTYQKPMLDQWTPVRPKTEGVPIKFILVN